jgi:hypothetical protein
MNRTKEFQQIFAVWKGLSNQKENETGRTCSLAYMEEGNLGINGEITLKWILKEQCVKKLTGFKWPMV